MVRVGPRQHDLDGQGRDGRPVADAALLGQQPSQRRAAREPLIPFAQSHVAAQNAPTGAIGPARWAPGKNCAHTWGLYYFQICIFAPGHCNMTTRQTADLPLHTGAAPAWLFRRMVLEVPSQRIVHDDRTLAVRPGEHERAPVANLHLSCGRGSMRAAMRLPGMVRMRVPPAEPSATNSRCKSCQMKVLSYQ